MAAGLARKYSISGGSPVGVGEGVGVRVWVGEGVGVGVSGGMVTVGGGVGEGVGDGVSVGTGVSVGRGVGVRDGSGGIGLAVGELIRSRTTTSTEAGSLATPPLAWATADTVCEPAGPATHCPLTWSRH